MQWTSLILSSVETRGLENSSSFLNSILEQNLFFVRITWCLSIQSLRRIRWVRSSRTRVAIDGLDSPCNRKIRSDRGNRIFCLLWMSVFLQKHLGLANKLNLFISCNWCYSFPGNQGKETSKCSLNFKAAKLWAYNTKKTWIEIFPSHVAVAMFQPFPPSLNKLARASVLCQGLCLKLGWQDDVGTLRFPRSMPASGRRWNSLLWSGPTEMEKQGPGSPEEGQTEWNCLGHIRKAIFSLHMSQKQNGFALFFSLENCEQGRLRVYF